MIEKEFDTEKRSFKTVLIDADFVVAGGGMAGVCAAISAAREGIKVALVQNRPVLGGNASSEIRLWTLGATSHMGNNNRWAREGGILDEILVENTYRNREGNPVIFDTVLLDKVRAEKNISLYLNTVIYNIEKSDSKNISSIFAYNAQNETKYKFSATYFCDSTGDGLLAYLAGATFRIGAEDTEEFDEKFAPDKEKYGEKLGHTILFYTKDAGKPVEYTAPDFALSMADVETKINRIQNPDYFNPKQVGCKYWWIEYGGRLDTIYDTEEINCKLQEVLYGIWNYIKNSAKYPDAANLTLEWVGTIPGKRESRRFMGYYVLNQKDIIEQHAFSDAVALGGWSLDLHPADGVFSKMKKACNQWHSKGIYPIPYRCYITPDLDNVFLAGRIISATHVAFASTRVMATSGAGGQAVGTAAAYCIKNDCTPVELMQPEKMNAYQQVLTKNGVYLPQKEVVLVNNLLLEAKTKVSSELKLSEIPFDGDWKNLEQSAAQMIPLTKGSVPKINVRLKSSKETQQKIELRISSKSFNHTPDITLETLILNLQEGEQEVELCFNTDIPTTCYGFICFLKNTDIAIQTSKTLITGIVSVFNKILPAVSNWGKQEAPEGIGVESFEFWCPERRPYGQNIAMKISPAIDCFSKENLLHPVFRPVEKTNAWVADLKDKNATIEIRWPDKKEIKEITLFVDTDYDHPMESVQWGHYDSKMPFCVDKVNVSADDKCIVMIRDNHQTVLKIVCKERLFTDNLKIELNNSNHYIPVAVFGIIVN